ncbi:GNAT family N-acetyltransferase [Arthrobacter cryoconiti]|uniref:GNAT family N-acetyltransferase n=1 Tax=Arthrobacter cryoconiti TaxID=748907 RepID=A0ABV8QYI9_9MICC|nr:N-acetyltransferase family protein [Arthrobacter cryoconiti]
MTPADWPAVERIYTAGIASGNATFADAPPSMTDFFASRIPELNLVATGDAGAVLGWVAATPTSGREVYRGVIEHSVYVDPKAGGRGIGLTLLNGLTERARTLGYWTIQSSIFPENLPSLALHDKAEFRRIGHRERVAHMTYGPHTGTWRDTILVEQRL